MIATDGELILVKIGHRQNTTLGKFEKLAGRHSCYLAKLMIEVSLIEIAARHSGLGQSVR